MWGRKINKNQVISGEIVGTRKIGRQHLLKPGDRNLLQEFVWNQLFNTSHAWVKVGGRFSRFMWNLTKSALLPGFNRSCLLIFHTPTSIDLYRQTTLHNDFNSFHLISMDVHVTRMIPGDLLILVYGSTCWPHAVRVQCFPKKFETFLA